MKIESDGSIQITQISDDEGDSNVFNPKPLTPRGPNKRLPQQLSVISDELPF